MGCCFSHKEDFDEENTNNTITFSSIPASSTLRNVPKTRAPQPSAEEKRKAAAAAAEERQQQWSQGGMKRGDQSKEAKERRDKDILIGKIEACYKMKNKDPPIGLPSCDIETLRKHYKGMQIVQ